MPVYDNKTYTKLMRPLPNFIERDIYNIPVMEPCKINISQMNNGLWLINMKNLSSKDKHPESKIVHSFCHDDTLVREFNNPYRYLEKTAKYLAASSFDFSMDSKMDFKQVLCATYDNRWTGAFLQSHGKPSMATVGWTTPEFYDITFAGLRDGGVFIISTLGTNNLLSYDEFIQGYHELRTRFPNSQLICVGDKLKGMDSDICFVKYEESFGTFDAHCDYWQPKLFNWDMTISKGVC